MTIKQALAQWMQDNGFGTQGTDLYIGAVPEEAPTACWWLVGGGGAPVQKNQTGEKTKSYVFTIFYRNTDSQDVDEQLQALEELANSKACHDLNGYDTIELEASGFQSDADLDAEDRTIGSVEITATVYQS